MNTVALIGRLGKKPELMTSPSGYFCRFSIFIKRPYKNKNGEYDSDIIQCVVWNAQAENLCKYADKGSLIAIDGALTTYKVTTNDGSSRNNTEVNCRSITYLDSKNKEEKQSDFNSNDFDRYNQTSKTQNNPNRNNDFDYFS